MSTPKLIDVLSERLPHVDFTQTDGLVARGKIDSLDIVMIIDAIDCAYGVSIPPAEIKSSNFDSIEAIASMINRAK